MFKWLGPPPLPVEAVNAVLRLFRRFRDMRALPPLHLSEPSRRGRTLSVDARGMWATLSGAGPAYSWTARFDPARSGVDSAYELNGATGLSGKTVWLYPGAGADATHGPDWRFEHPRQPHGHSCTGQACVRLFDTCLNQKASGWHIKIVDPNGVTVYDLTPISSPGFCNAGVALDPSSPIGTYTITATKSVDLSPWGGPNPYTMTFTGSVAVTDPCGYVNTTINLCEDYAIVTFPTGCLGPIVVGTQYAACDPATTLTVTTTPSLGGCTKTVGYAQANVGTCLFYGYGCSVTSFDWSASYSVPTTFQTSTGTQSLCPRPGNNYGNTLRIPVGNTPQSGYVCGCCNWPVPTTLHYSDSSGASCLLTFNAQPTLLPGWWVGTASDGTSNDTCNVVTDGYNTYCDLTGGTYTCVIGATCTCTAAGVKWYVVKWFYVCSAPGTPPFGHGCSCARIGNQQAPILNFNDTCVYSDAYVLQADCSTPIDLVGTLSFHGNMPLCCSPQAAGNSNFSIVP
jgi:hypothetical protein